MALDLLRTVADLVHRALPPTGWEVQRYVKDTKALLNDISHDESGRVSAVTDLTRSDPLTPWLHGNQTAAPLFALAGELLEAEEEISNVDRLSFSSPVYSNLHLSASRTPLRRRAGPVSAQFQTTKGSTISVISSENDVPLKSGSRSSHPLSGRLRLQALQMTPPNGRDIYANMQRPVAPAVLSRVPAPHFHLEFWYQSFVHSGFSAVEKRFFQPNMVVIRSVDALVVPNINVTKNLWGFSSTLVDVGVTSSGFNAATVGVVCHRYDDSSAEPAGRALVTYVAVPPLPR